MPILREGTSCDYHRIVLPFKFLQYDIVNTLDEAEIVVFNRIPHIDVDVFLIERRKRGFKYVIDLDDYWRLSQTHYLSSIFERIGMSNKIEKLMRYADAVTVTNEALYIKAKQFNKNVHIIPNGIPFNYDQFTDFKESNNKMKFIYAGGISHKNDVLLLGNKISSLKVDFTLAGYIPDNEQSNIILRNIHFKKIYVKENKSLNEYMDIYNDVDVSLVPLEKNLFNLCKSNLKIIEAGCKNIAVIASKVLPYYNPIDHKFINYAENPSDWYATIKYFIKNPNYVKDKGLALGEHVRENYDLLKINKLREDLYNSL